MASSVEPDFGSTLALKLERLFYRVGVLGMACEAIEDTEQKNCLAGSMADAQEIIFEMMNDVKALRLLIAEPRPPEAGEIFGEHVRL